MFFSWLLWRLWLHLGCELPSQRTISKRSNLSVPPGERLTDWLASRGSWPMTTWWSHPDGHHVLCHPDCHDACYPRWLSACLPRAPATPFTAEGRGLVTPWGGRGLSIMTCSAPPTMTLMTSSATRYTCSLCHVSRVNVTCSCLDVTIPALIDFRLHNSE